MGDVEPEPSPYIGCGAVGLFSINYFRTKKTWEKQPRIERKPGFVCQTKDDSKIQTAPTHESAHDTYGGMKPLTQYFGLCPTIVWVWPMCA